MPSCPTTRDLGPGAGIVCRLSLQRQMSLWAEVRESQERTLKDEWNWERIRMAGGVVLRGVHVLISVTYKYVNW